MEYLLAPPFLWHSIYLSTLCAHKLSWPPLPLEPAHSSVPDFESSMINKLNKHKNNVENWQKIAQCQFCQVASQKQEISSIFINILLKKDILTIKNGKVSKSQKNIKCFSNCRRTWVKLGSDTPTVLIIMNVLSVHREVFRAFTDMGSSMRL